MDVKKLKVGVVLLKTLSTTFWFTFAMGFVLRIGSDALAFVQPLLIKELITFVENSQVDPTNGTQSEQFEWHGYFFACTLPLVGIVKTILYQNQFHYAYKLGMDLRTAVTGMIYRKALRLSSGARQLATVGEIVNLMSIDAARLEEAATFIHMAWSTPIVITISLGLIYLQLGWSAMAGLCLAVLLIPINVTVVNRCKVLQMQFMQIKDERIKLLDQTFCGIKVLKMYAWEPAFQHRLSEFRNNEVRLLRRIAYLRSVSTVSAFCAPLLILLATFGAYVLSSTQNVLDAKQAFVSLSLFNILVLPLSILPNVVAVMVQTSISLKRIQRFLLLPELEHPALESSAECAANQRHHEGDFAIRIKDGTFGWSNESILFKNLDFTVPKGQFLMIVGPVGCGKSSLLSCILKEMHCFKGEVAVNGSVAYVPQQAWCVNATLRDNILFGKSMDLPFYRKVLRRCCLLDDLKQLPDGDMTEIGERGLNLSGGQKQRISLARAVYQQSDIYLLDDPLSAVDPHVANNLFSKVIGPRGLLRNKTEILVTHRLINLEEADLIMTMQRTVFEECQSNEVRAGHFNLAFEDSEPLLQSTSNVGCSVIGECGTFNELMNNNGPFAEFVRNFVNKQNSDQDVNTAGHIESNLSCTDGRFLVREQSDLADRLSLNSSHESVENGERSELPCLLIQSEQVETGQLRASVLKTYQKAYGSIVTLITFLCYVMFIFSYVGGNVWLSVWTQGSTYHPQTHANNTLQRDYFLGIYGVFGVAQVIFIMGKVVCMSYGCANASKNLHSKLLKNILKAPMSFFDTTPTGRIVNRFSLDIDTVDQTIPTNLRIFCFTFLEVLAAVILISISIPSFLLTLVPIGLLFIAVQRLYIRTGRQLKRIESIKRSPIYSHFQESLMGITSIRAYDCQTRFVDKLDRLVDESQMARYPNLISFRWLGVVIEMLGHLICIFVCLFAVAKRETIGAGYTGMAITYTLRLSNSLVFLIRTVAEMEASFVCVERIKEYSKVQNESLWTIDVPGERQVDWPSAGSVTFERYSARYRPGLEFVLNQICCEIKGGERVGIVGKTGAGKSSLTYALFRLFEAAEGRILIDGTDVSRIGLHDLREKITIIPQDPVLFAESIRFNLDPTYSRSDDELWKALEEAHLRNTVEELSGGLDYQCSEGGDNFSVGQRQLFCLARALLRRTKILVLDEATAAIDMLTDEMIQATIRSSFAGHTVLTIAHRIVTVLNYDKILVLKNGMVLEYDSPQRLLANSESQFYQMCKEAGIM